MWMWRSFLCVSLVCGLALDSNTIRSSKESLLQSSELPEGSNGERPVRRLTESTSNSNRGSTPSCSTPDCEVPQRGRCSNRAQRRPSTQDRQVDRRVDRIRDTETDLQSNTEGFNRTKAPEMSSCVRSGDCADGLCCVRYLTGKRCQRIPVEGEACLLRGSGKLRRKLGRCDCDVGLSCAAVNRAESGKAKGQGVCLPSQRNTRNSGKKEEDSRRGDKLLTDYYKLCSLGTHLI